MTMSTDVLCVQQQPHITTAALPPAPSFTDLSTSLPLVHRTPSTRHTPVTTIIIPAVRSLDRFALKN